MKRLVEEKGGLEELIGKTVTLLCCRYIYTGKLIGVDDFCVELEDAHIVYETGSFAESKWKDAQSLNAETWMVSRASIEGFGLLRKEVCTKEV